MKKLYVGNLSFKATEEQVQALFAEIGVQPDSLTLLRDRFTGQPRGFGFAEIHDDAEAEKAVAALNGKDFLGRALVVNEARPQREGGGAGGGGGRGGHGGQAAVAVAVVGAVAMVAAEEAVDAVAIVVIAAAVAADAAATAADETGNFLFGSLTPLSDVIDRGIRQTIELE